ncbi:MAG: pseudouridine synthase [Pirellulaceae bacterium]|nr:MAG: pseudouridine synthase [Pirellulaceae bacterium]
MAAVNEFLVTAQIPPPARSLVRFVAAMARVKHQEALRRIHAGAVSVNGRTSVQSHHCLQVGDRVRIEALPPAPPRLQRAPSAANRQLKILYEDDQLVVVDKPAGLLTVPTPAGQGHTLLHQIQRHIERGDRRAKAICVHRLDRDVSGILVFAKTAAAAERLRRQFASHQPLRRYVAIVAGSPDDDSGTIRSHMRTDQRSLHRYSSREPAGQWAVTHWRLVERHRAACMIEVRLETGRRNQIRVHMADLGHPILGDSRYGRLRWERQPQLVALWPWKRLALHAASLGLLHPRSGRRLQFTSPVPSEFGQLMETLRSQ